MSTSGAWDVISWILAPRRLEAVKNCFETFRDTLPLRLIFTAQARRFISQVCRTPWLFTTDTSLVKFIRSGHDVQGGLDGVAVPVYPREGLHGRYHGVDLRVEIDAAPVLVPESSDAFATPSG
jgi:hypothetical protein